MKYILNTLLVMSFGLGIFAQEDWRGTYTYSYGEETYELEVFGPEGELEGDFKCVSEGGSYKISLNLYVEDDLLHVEAVKTWEGTCPIQKAIDEDHLMFKLSYVNDFLITEIGSHNFGRFKKGEQEIVFTIAE